MTVQRKRSAVGGDDGRRQAAMTGARASLRRRRTAMRAACIAGVFGLAAAGGAASAGEPLQSPAPRFWGDFGIGLGQLNAGSAPSGDNGTGVLFDLTVGGRLGDHWLMGLNIGGVGSQISNSYYDTNDRYSSIYGQSVTNLFLTVQFEPAGDAGWLYGVGAGRVFYHNHALETVTGDYRNGDGTAGELHVGYDWAFPGHLHVETRLGVETGRVSLDAPIGGSFSFTAVGLSVHVAYH